MAGEAFAIIWRRFYQRLLESGLLVLAVALGVGAAAAGITLVHNAQVTGDRLLASVDNREIVVSNQDDAEEMEAPAVKRQENDMTVLTVSDLAAAELIPQVSQAYVSNEDEIHFINRTFLERGMQGPQSGGLPGAGGGSPESAQQTAGADAALSNPSVSPVPENKTAGAGQAGNGPMAEAAGQAQTLQVQTAKEKEDGAGSGSLGGNTGGSKDGGNEASGPEGGPGGPGGSPMDMDELKSMAAGDDVILPDVETMKGFEVSPGFFTAWNITPQMGSLFSSDDSSGSGTSVLVLGYKAAKTLAGDDRQPKDLLGKKLLAFGSYRTIVGILAPTPKDRFDESYFAPARDYSNKEGGGGPRFRSMNTQLRFVVGDPKDLAAAQGLISEWFSSRYGEGKVMIDNPREQTLALIRRNNGTSLLILFLSLSGLFIASVNVSNMLLSRGMRMTRSTGILMALGSTRQGIRRLFLKEALLIALLGGALGWCFAWFLTMNMEQALGMDGSGLLNILPGLGLSLILVLVFSFIPALQNSRQNPADAMRQG